MQALAGQYQAIVRSSDCKDLMELMMSIYTKRCQAEQQKRRLGMMDEHYMKQAENLLFGEFSAALGIPYDDVRAYIAARVETLSAAQT
jgi:CarD family transcriptional regulator